MMSEIEFEKVYQSMLQLLVRQHDWLHQYRQRDNCSERFAREREEDLILLGRFVEASVRLVQELKEEVQANYQQGFERGKEWSPHSSHAYREGGYHMLDAMQLMGVERKVLIHLLQRMERGKLHRRFSKLHSKERWPELY
ncbi:MAG: hypothetical protein AAFV25_19935 [Bacteroidota bacterium]